MTKKYLLFLICFASLKLYAQEDQIDSANSRWNFSAWAEMFIIPGAEDFFNPTFYARHNSLHLEARYNYEALDTGSLWAGYNFSAGEKLVFEFAPMVGGVFGDLTGIAPGYNLALTYSHFTLSSQSEYFLDTGNSENNFFYTWSELTYAPWEWLRAGLVAQRTKAYKSELDIQRGFLVGVSYRSVDITTYVFNLGWTDPTVVLAIGCHF